jgi:hypothetical protein
MGLLERHGEVRASVVPNRSGPILQGEIHCNVALGSTVYTDQFASYRGLDAAYIHDVINHSEECVRGHIHTNGIANFWSGFKRVIYGTHHNVEPFHLHRDDVRFTVTAARVNGRRVTYKELTAKVGLKGAGA